MAFGLLTFEFGWGRMLLIFPRVYKYPPRIFYGRNLYPCLYSTIQPQNGQEAYHPVLTFAEGEDTIRHQIMAETLEDKNIESNREPQAIIEYTPLYGDDGLFFVQVAKTFFENSENVDLEEVSQSDAEEAMGRKLDKAPGYVKITFYGVSEDRRREYGNFVQDVLDARDGISLLDSDMSFMSIVNDIGKIRASTHDVYVGLDFNK